MLTCETEEGFCGGVFLVLGGVGGGFWKVCGGEMMKGVKRVRRVGVLKEGVMIVEKGDLGLFG